MTGTKRWLAAAFAAVLSFFVFASAKALNDPLAESHWNSRAVYLYNPETDTVLVDKNAGEKMYPASLTKLLTALVVTELSGDLKNETIRVESLEPFRYILEEEGHEMGLAAGEEFCAYDILVGMLVNSFCDASDLLAVHVCGSVESFVAKMNEKAASLGLKNSHFANAHGLHDPDHYSTAADMAVILREALKNETVREIFSIREYTIPATPYRDARTFRHTVDFFDPSKGYHLDCCIGGKSGFTDDAGRCLAAAFEKDGVTLLGVFMGANMEPGQYYAANLAYQDAHDLVTTVFQCYTLRALLEEGEKVAELPVEGSERILPVLAGEGVRILIPQQPDGSDPVDVSLDLPERLLPEEVADGKTVGTWRLLLEGEETNYTAPLVLSWDGTPLFPQKEGPAPAEGSEEEESFSPAPFLFAGGALILVLAAVVALTRMEKKRRGASR